MERRGSRWSRRGFMVGAAGLGLLAGCGRLPGREPLPRRIPRVGVLVDLGLATAAPPRFQQGLRDLQPISIGYRSVAQSRARPTARCQPAYSASRRSAGMQGEKRRSACHRRAISATSFQMPTVSPAR
jgi:hypothetical protein